MSVEVGRLLGANPPKFVRQGDSSLILPDTYVGLEFEVENFPAATNLPREVTDYWSIKEDHSLRNRGMELVFAEPLFGRDIILAVEGFFNWQKGTKLQTSIRTGLHVHLDVREVPVQSVISFMMIYSALEPLIYKWVGNNREESNFCVPFYYSDDAAQRAHQVLHALVEDMEEWTKKGVCNRQGKDFSQNFERYAGLNLNALGRFGSIEFRQMPMVFNRQTVLDWINIIMAIKRAAVKSTPYAVRHMLRTHQYNINTVAEAFDTHLGKMLGHFTVDKALGRHAAYLADRFYTAGQLRRWKEPKGKYLGKNLVLAKRRASKVGRPAVAEPAEEEEEVAARMRRFAMQLGLQGQLQRRTMRLRPTGPDYGLLPVGLDPTQRPGDLEF